jgi:hypothetical protein
VAKRKQKKRAVYHDRKTGKQVSAKKWKRSKAHGGTRYVRKYIRISRKRAVPARREDVRRPPKEAAVSGEVFEWIVTGYASARYEGKKGHVLNIIATGRSAKEAMDVAKDFSIGYRGLRETVITKAVKANRTNEDSGLAEWRNRT